MFNKSHTPKPPPSLHGNAFLAQLIASKSGVKIDSRVAAASAASVAPNSNGGMLGPSDLPQSPSARMPASSFSSSSARRHAAAPKATSPNLMSLLGRNPVVSSTDNAAFVNGGGGGGGKDAFAQYSMGAGGLYVVPKSTGRAGRQNQDAGAKNKKRRLTKNPFSMSVRHAKTPAVSDVVVATPGTAVALAGLASRQAATDMEAAAEEEEEEQSVAAKEEQPGAVVQALIPAVHHGVAHAGLVIDLSAKKVIAGPTAAERMRAREAEKRSAAVLGGGVGGFVKRKTKKMKTLAEAKHQQQQRKKEKKKKKAAAGFLSFFKKNQNQAALVAKSEEKPPPVEIINIGI
jgi:hypothetical protein